MTAPRTRLEEGTTDFERDLLRSWQHEQPSAEARKSALGIGVAGAFAGATTAASATGAAGTAIAEGLAPKATAVAVWAIGKWIAAGAIVGSSAVWAVPHLRSAASVNAPQVERATATPSTRETPAPPLPANDTPTANEVLPDPAPTAAELPIEQAPETVRSAPARALSRSPRNVPPTVESAQVPAADPPVEEKRSSRGLGEQVVTIDRAESALAAGNVSEALRMVDDYESRFPSGSLSQEAAVLRIEALLKQGKREEAVALANRFLAAHPSSPYATKLRRRLDGDSNR
jgi:hypothetical protein